MRTKLPHDGYVNSKQTILLVEDNDSDEFLTKRAIGRADLNCEVVVARNGQVGCDLAQDSSRTYSLVLLDIKMPIRSGFEVLEVLRSKARTRYLPVIMMSSSDEPGDIQRALDLGANSYVRKALEPDVYDSSLKVLLYYWLVINQAAPETLSPTASNHASNGQRVEHPVEMSPLVAR